MKKKDLFFLFFVLPFWGCYANATAARTAQTKSAQGWYCMEEPRVDCKGECTGYTQTWYAYCGDKRYICKLNDQRDSSQIIANNISGSGVESKYEGTSCVLDTQ